MRPVKCYSGVLVVKEKSEPKVLYLVKLFYYGSQGTKQIREVAKIWVGGEVQILLT